MNNVESATLTLSTGVSIYNNTLKTSFTWNNMNLRTVLGSMYDKYDTFNLCLTSIGQPESSTTFTLANNDALVYYKMSGLPFLNDNIVNNSSGNISQNSSVIGSFIYSTTPTLRLYNSNSCTFGKNQDICNITIDAVRCSDLLPPSAVALTTYPDVSFIFNIYGIVKDKGNLNASRLEIK